MSKIRVTDSTGLTAVYTPPLTVALEADTIPPIVHSPTFSATPQSITAGQYSTLAWNCPGASALHASWRVPPDNGVSGPADKWLVSPAQTMTYTLTVSYPGQADVTLTQTVTVQPVVTPPPVVVPPTGTLYLGVHVMGNGPAADKAYAAGCRWFTVMDGKDICARLAAGGARGMFRRYFVYPPTVEWMASDLSSLPDGWIGTGVNENENTGWDVAAHAKWDIAVAERLHQLNPKVIYAGATYSVGVPDITKQDICDAIKQYYAPAYNSGLMWWDQHNYAPDYGHIFRTDGDQVWYELRHVWYFTKCGFDPTIQHIVSSESGLDVGGSGGFAAFHDSDEQVVAFCNAWRSVMSAPITVNGKVYPSPYVGGSFYQADPTANQWKSYDLSLYIAAMGAAGVWA